MFDGIFLVSGICRLEDINVSSFQFLVEIYFAPLHRRAVIFCEAIIGPVAFASGKCMFSAIFACTLTRFE